MASLVPDPLLAIRGPGGSSIGDSNSQGSRPQVSSSLSGICNEDIRVPDKMVGLSKSKYQKEPRFYFLYEHVLHKSYFIIYSIMICYDYF